jgi:hypothetical protein
MQLQTDPLDAAGFALYSMAGDDGTDGSMMLGVDGWYQDEFGNDYFGWNPFKAVAKAVSSVAKTVVKVAVAPAKAVVGTAVGIAQGKNVLQTLKKQGGELATSTLSGVKIVGNVASFIPGLGTGVAFAIQYTGSVGEAIAAGKNVLASAKSAAINAALNSLPGGELTGALIKTVANVAAAGVQGQDVLKSAAHELVGAAVGLIPNAQAQAVLAAAADSALKGENVLQGAKAAAINQALAQIPDVNARAVVSATLNKKPLTDVVKTAGASLMSKAAGAMPTGGVATLVTGVTKKNPNQIVIISGASGIKPPVRTITPAMAAAKAAAVAKAAAPAKPAPIVTPKPAAPPLVRVVAPAAPQPPPVAPVAIAAKPVPTPVPMAFMPQARAPVAIQSTVNLPPLAFGARRIANTIGGRRLTYDISAQGVVSTFVT